MEAIIVDKAYDFIYFNIINNSFEGADYEINSSYIRSYLKTKEIITQQYINLEFSTLDALIEDILLKTGNRQVFYINEYNYYISKVVINGIKNRDYLRKIICIGPSTDYIYNHLSLKVFIDYYCMGNYYNFLEKMLKCRNYEEEFEISYNNSAVAIRDKEKREIIELDIIPHPYSNGIVPAYEIINMGMYSSMGCYGRCNFCSYIKNGSTQSYSVTSIIQELLFIKDSIGDKNIEIKFIDDCFSLSSSRIIDICDGIIRNNLSFIFWCCTRVDLMTYEVLNKMKMANFNNIVIGMESASINILNNLGKLINDVPIDFLDKIAMVYQYSKEIGLDLIVSVNFGLVGETYEDALATIEYLQNKNIDKVSINFMTVFSESRIFNEPSNFKEVEFYPGPTGLPLRTFYINYNIVKISQLLQSLNIDKQFHETYNNRNHNLNMLEYITGIIYSHNHNLRNDCKHITIETVNEQVISFMKKNFLLDGVVWMNKDKLTIKNKVAFSDNRKQLKIQLKEFDDNLALYNANDCFIQNQYFISQNNRMNIMTNNYIIPDMIAGIVNIEFKTLCKRLIQNYNEFSSKNVFTLYEIQQSIFRNMCRFSGKCTAKSLPRIGIFEDQVSLCNENYCVGQLHEDIEGLYHRLLQKRAKKECETCSHNKTCSKCLILSEEYKGEFCKLIKEYPYLSSYVSVIVFICKNFIDNKMETIYIYSDLNYNLHNKYVDFQNFFMIIHIKSLYIIYNSLTNKAYFCNSYESEFIEKVIIHKIKWQEDLDVINRLQYKISNI